MIFIPDVKNKQFFVVGLGLSGKTAYESLKKSGAVVTAWDDNEILRRQAQNQGMQIQSYETIDWSVIQALVLSPGIPHLYPTSHPSAHLALEKKVPIICDVDLLAQSQKSSRYIGITGTNGKSTTTALIGHLLNHADLYYQIGGNIGLPVLTLNSLSKNETYVLELSSYQLERVPHLQLDYAVLLDVTSDHLERHGGLEGYQKAKAKIFDCLKTNDSKGIAIVSIDTSMNKQIYEKLKQDKHQIITISGLNEKADIFFQKGQIFINNQLVIDITKHPVLKGNHNTQNAAIVYALGHTMGLDSKVISAAIQTFKGLAHRLEPIGEINGISFVNDSKGTNAEATAKALSCFQSIYWIVGGQAKESGLEGLDVYYPFIEHAYLIGDAAERFSKILHGKVPYTQCFTLDKAVYRAFADANQWSSLSNRKVILLSPACASWDQFKNFEERGECFRSIFQNIEKTL